MNNEVKFVSPFKRMCITVGNLPTAYIESMSYYEGLTFLVNYLANNVIPALNGNSEAIKELQEKYVELKSYVDNYFENLDVQEEINNKLDEMADNGTLAAVISEYLNSIALFSFSSVADMKAAENLIDGSKCMTFGFSDINDGGNAFYNVREVLNTDVVDEKYLIALHDPQLVAELMINEKQVNVLQLGAKDDGTEDIGAIVNEALSKNLRVYVPRGNYLVDTTIHTEGFSELVIDGDLTYSGNDSCIKIDNQYNIVKTKNITTTNGICVLIESNDPSQNICLQNRLSFQDLESTNNHGLYIHAKARGIGYNEISFNSISANASKYAIYLKTESSGGSTRWINENIINGGTCTSGLYGLYIDTNTTPENGESNGNKFNHISFEGVTNGIYVNNARANLFDVPRVAEINAANKIITLAGNLDGNVFNILSLVKPTTIDISGMGSYDALNNFINCEIIDSDSARHGRNMITYKGRLQIRELLFKYNYKNMTSSLASIDDNFMYNYLLITNSNSPSYKLNQYYGSKGINELFIKTNFGNAFTLTDNYNNSVSLEMGLQRKPLDLSNCPKPFDFKPEFTSEDLTIMTTAAAGGVAIVGVAYVGVALGLPAAMAYLGGLLSSPLVQQTAQ